MMGFQRLHHGVSRRLLRLMPDAAFVRRSYKHANGVPLDLAHPQTFSEKLSWLKLNYLTDLQMTCVDKLAVRDYVARTVGEEVLIPLLWQGTAASQVHPDVLTVDQVGQAFALKTTHDSGGVVLCWNRDTFDWDRARAFVAQRLRQNFYWEAREAAYRHTPRRILAEALLPSSPEVPLEDIKLWCFGGRVQIIQMAFVQQSFGADGFTGGAVAHAFYRPDWKRVDMKFLYPSYQGEARRPDALDRLIAVAEALSEPFPFARVDLYAGSDDTVHFGEITFYPLAGNRRVEPEDLERELGDWITLPEPQRVQREARG